MLYLKCCSFTLFVELVRQIAKNRRRQWSIEISHLFPTWQLPAAKAKAGLPQTHLVRSQQQIVVQQMCLGVCGSPWFLPPWRWSRTVRFRPNILQLVVGFGIDHSDKLATQQLATLRKLLHACNQQAVSCPKRLLHEICHPKRLIRLAIQQCNLPS